MRRRRMQSHVWSAFNNAVDYNGVLPYSDQNLVLWVVVGRTDQVLGLQMQVRRTLLLGREPSF